MLRDKKTLFAVLRVVGLILPVVFFYFCFRNVDWHTLWQALRAFPKSAMFGIILIVSLLPAVKTLQWKIFASRYGSLSFRSLYPTVSVWMMAVNVFPLWAGEALAIYLLGKKQGMPKSAALSVITLDQICEGISLAAIFSVLAYAAAIPAWMQHSMRAILALIALAFLALLYFSWKHREAPNGGEDAASGFWGKLRRHFGHWAHHLEPLRKPSKFLPGLALTFSVRAVEIATLYLLEKSFGLELPGYAPFLVVAALHLAMFIPFSPGNLGLFEAAVFAAYRFLGVEATTALGLALCFHVFTALPLIAQGYWYYLRLGLKETRGASGAAWSLAQQAER